ncbi:MAG: hypothetical protein P4M08_14950 [Oligoflexia bacterium]|nr:hypothetical protein [Oligoflexia bacterium]
MEPSGTQLSERIERLLAEGARLLASEGRVFIESKLLSYGVEALQVVRMLAILQYCLMLLAIAQGASFFAAAFFAFKSYSDGYSIFSNPYTLFCLSIFAASTLASVFLTRKKTWLEVSGLKKRLDRTLAPRSISAEEIERVVERAIERKLEKYDLKKAPQ